MLDNIWTLLPYFDAGIVAAVVARFTGMNLSMTVLFALLYIGATPVEAVMSMLVFNPFTYFTVYTQQHIYLFSGCQDAHSRYCYAGVSDL